MGGWDGFDAAKEEQGDADEDDQGGEGEFAAEVGAGEEDVGEAGKGGEGWKRVEPEAEGTGEVGLRAAKVEDADVLGEELQEEADDDHGGDDVRKREEAEEGGGGGKGEERDEGEAAGGVEAGEDTEEVAVGRGGVRDARVAEQKGEDAGEGGHHDEDGGDLGEEMSDVRAEGGGVGRFHEEGDHGPAGGEGLLGEEVLPGEYGKDGEVHGDIEGGYDCDREEDGAGDGAARVLDLAAEEGDVVVAPVVVGGDEHGGGEAGKEGRGEGKDSGWEVDGLGEVSVEEAGDDDPGDGSEDDREHDDRERADAGEVPVEEDNGEEDGGDGDEGGGTDGDGGGVGAEMDGVEQGVAGERGGEEGGVLAEADGSAGNRERAGEEDLEEEEEAEDLADASGVDDAEVGVGPASLGKGGAELCPDEAVAKGKEGSEDPAEHGLGTAHSADEERKGDEGADADHVEQIERHCAAEIERADELDAGLGLGADEVEFSGWLGESRG